MGAAVKEIDVDAAKELRTFPKGVWRCPVELVLACSWSVWVDTIRARRAAGDRYHPTATVFARDDRLFAVVSFYGPGRPQLQFALDAWLDPVPPPFERRQP